jgi:HlyD family secretion protein
MPVIEMLAPGDPACASPFPRIRRLALFGAALIAVFIVGFGAWSAVAPLKSAALASGVVAVESNRKTIQHLESGIIDAILVHDGDTVAAGQPLIRLDSTRARTDLAALQSQFWDALAGEARLVAQRDGRDRIDFPDDLLARVDDPVLARVMAGQRGIFDTRRSSLRSKTAVIRRRIAETDEEINGLKAQVAAAEQQGAILHEQIEVMRPLVARGLEAKPQILSLQRNFAQVEGQRGTALAQIARAKQSIAEAEIEILNLDNDARKQTADELRDTQQKIHELREKVEAATDVMTRTVVRAPEAGVVTDLRVHTPGGVVNAGDPLMDLVPERDRLIVEGRVKPQDIDVVHVGLAAEVRLLPYKQRRTPSIDGRVIYVSADRLVDKSSNQPYYAAKVRVDEQELARLKGVEMVPGMPSEVMIETGETTVALYALAPILDSFHRAFREQ